MTMRHFRRKSGFTIVEIIVVIIVIAILATITIVSYNGIVKSAYNTQVVSGVKSHYDAVKLYYLQNGRFPRTQTEVDGDRIALTCLGKGYKDQHCGRVTNVEVYEDPLFNAELKTLLQTQTNPVSNQLLPVPGESFVGAVYGLDITGASSTGYGRTIQYALHGSNMNCGVSGSYAYSSSSNATACEILLEEVEQP